MSLLYLKYQSRKKLQFPRIENLSKIIHLDNFYQKIGEKCTNITMKGPYKTIGEEKLIKQTPHEILKY
jgi:hypothetical protein